MKVLSVCPFKTDQHEFTPKQHVLLNYFNFLCTLKENLHTCLFCFFKEPGHARLTSVQAL